MCWIPRCVKVSVKPCFADGSDGGGDDDFEVDNVEDVGDGVDVVSGGADDVGDDVGSAAADGDAVHDDENSSFDYDDKKS